MSLVEKTTFRIQLYLPILKTEFEINIMDCIFNSIRKSLSTEDLVFKYFEEKDESRKFPEASGTFFGRTRRFEYSLTCESGLAGTMEVVNQVNAGGPVEALSDAVINIVVTMSARPTLSALACVATWEVEA
jgi:hypothetical protein